MKKRKGHFSRKKSKNSLFYLIEYLGLSPYMRTSKVVFPSVCLHMLDVKVFRYMDIVLAILGIPTHYYFGPGRHLSFVSTKFEIKPVLACWQQQMHGQNKGKGHSGFTLGQKGKRQLFQRPKKKKLQ